LVAGQPKKVVAGTFFEFLVLKTRNRIDLKQEQPYGDILVSKTVPIPITLLCACAVECVSCL
jgi:chromatin segregation and condensation protein Rec8/ScpA/Scc1 (kleisin family)